MRVFLDTETTSLHPGQIAQLSYILTDDDLHPVRARSYYFQVQSIDPGAAAVHGLTLKGLRELSGGRRFCDHFPEIYADLADHPLICHNVNFDLKFMRAEYYQVGYPYEPRDKFCTMVKLRSVCKLGKNPKLQEAVRHFGIRDFEIAKQARQLFQCAEVGAHDARFDVTAAFMVASKASSVFMPWVRASAIDDSAILAASREAAAAVAPADQFIRNVHF